MSFWDIGKAVWGVYKKYLEYQKKQAELKKKRLFAKSCHQIFSENKIPERAAQIFVGGISADYSIEFFTKYNEKIIMKLSRRIFKKDTPETFKEEYLQKLFEYWEYILGIHLIQHIDLLKQKWGELDHELNKISAVDIQASVIILEKYLSLEGSNILEKEEISVLSKFLNILKLEFPKPVEEITDKILQSEKIIQNFQEKLILRARKLTEYYKSKPITILGFNQPELLELFLKNNILCVMDLINLPFSQLYNMISNHPHLPTIIEDQWYKIVKMIIKNSYFNRKFWINMDNLDDIRNELLNYLEIIHSSMLYMEKFDQIWNNKENSWDILEAQEILFDIDSLLVKYNYSPQGGQIILDALEIYMDENPENKMLYSIYKQILESWDAREDDFQIYDVDLSDFDGIDSGIDLYDEIKDTLQQFREEIYIPFLTKINISATPKQKVDFFTLSIHDSTFFARKTGNQKLLIEFLQVGQREIFSPEKLKEILQEKIISLTQKKEIQKPKYTPIDEWPKKK